jgi:hypothetical protein
MSQERGRQQKDKLEQISNEYSSLHALFKKLTTYEEEMSSLNKNFSQQWLKIEKTEDEDDLKGSISTFSSALFKSEDFRTESLSHIKKYIQEPLKVYPLKIKKQKRSLSRNARSAREDDRQQDDIEEKIKKYDEMHVADMKQLMLHLINAEMFFHCKSIELFSDVYEKIIAND